MSRKPTLARLSELSPGQYADCFVLLSARSRGATRDGKPYFSCRFRDAKRTVSFMVWADGGWFEDCEAAWRQGEFYKVRARYVEHEKYGPQLDIENIRRVTEADRADGFDPAQFIDGSRFDPAAMLAELTGIVEKEIADEPLRRLVRTILERHAEPLKNLPATLRHFFPFPGGLLEHTLSVTKNCMFLADRYLAHYPDLTPPLNRDLVIAGAVLHDIGRVLELAGEPQAVEPTIPGRLFGHLFLGRDLVRDTARELGDVNPELVQLLEHLIISHLNLPEWGSPRLPLVPECLILHHADDLDAKIEMYARCLTNDTEEGPFTARDSVLGRRLFKGRGV
jgi:3'-5' exoribonuclease